MGLDSVNLQVLSTAGSDSEKKNAAKVLKLLERGRHWVLVVLLLSNVIGEWWLTIVKGRSMIEPRLIKACPLLVNEALPIFLSDFGGTWAVLS